MDFSRSRWFGLLAGIVAVIATSLPAAAQAQKPNILFIMADDISYQAVFPTPPCRACWVQTRSPPQ
jgi:hypothetical protein